MFSNIAYEAMYQYIGLALHSEFIKVITSQKFFLAVLMVIFGWGFFITSVHFFSRYMPGSLVRRRFVPLSKYFKVTVCFFLALMFLRVESGTSVKRFNGDSWHSNPYVRAKVSGVKPEYRVSFIFDVLSRTAEETAALIARIVDKVFQKGNSQLEAPNFFFKALMYAGSSTIEDKNLREALDFYTEQCFDRIIPAIRNKDYKKVSRKLFNESPALDGALTEIVLSSNGGSPYTCLDVKNDVREALRNYANSKGGNIPATVHRYFRGVRFNADTVVNLQVSSLLVNHYISKREGYLGLQKGATPPKTGWFAQAVRRTLSWAGVYDMFGAPGAWVAANRSVEFSENLARAPHVAGFIKMILIAVFPWLAFLVAAGYWRSIVYWFVIYFSVLMWAPLWNLLYHIMVGISLSAEATAAFGEFGDGISLYGAQIVNSRIYHMFAIYSWLQLMIGVALTGSVIFFMRGVLADSEGDSMGDVVSTGGNLMALSSGPVGAAGSAINTARENFRQPRLPGM